MKNVRAPLLLVAFVWAACGSEAEDLPTPDAGDAADDTGGDVDASTDGVDDAEVDATADAREDVPPDDAPDAPDVTPDTPDGGDVTPDTLDGGDATDVEACLEACGVGCPGPLQRPCASDGAFYCSECAIACYGLTAVDPGSCSPGPLCPEPEGERLAREPWTLPEGCWSDLMFLRVEGPIEDEETFAEQVSCDEGVTSGLDWAEERLGVFSVAQNPYAPFRGVWDAGDAGYVGLFEAPRYCGGAPPPDTVVLVLLPADGRPVSTSVCSYGICTGPPRP